MNSTFTSKYEIHATEDLPLYPAHTHGLMKLGLPELFIDPLSYKNSIKASIINRVALYLNDQKNAETLRRIRQGEIIELKSSELIPENKVEKEIILCLRLVLPTFTAVMLAYPEETFRCEKLEVVQIWVRGDDFAITDKYYANGIQW